MKNNEMIQLKFDKYVFPVPREVIKAHGKEWKAVCKELDANASPHLNNDFTNHIIS